MLWRNVWNNAGFIWAIIVCWNSMQIVVLFFCGQNLYQQLFRCLLLVLVQFINYIFSMTGEDKSNVKWMSNEFAWSVASFIVPMSYVNFILLPWLYFP